MSRPFNIGSAFKVLIKDPRLLVSNKINIITLWWLRLKCFFTGKKMYYISLVESMGDIVATEPMIRHLASQYQNHYLVWITQKPYKDIPASHPLIRRVITVTCLTEWMILRCFIRKKRITDLHLAGKICNRHSYTITKPNPFDITPENYFFKGNLLFAFSRAAGITLSEHEAPKLYLNTTSPVIDAPYIVLHSSSNMPVKTFSPETWQQLTEYVLSAHPGLKIAEIGFEKQYSGNDPRAMDYTGKKDLALIAGLIKHAQLFIGIDSGFAHFANAMEKDSLIFIGQYEHFSHYMPYSGYLEQQKEDCIWYSDDYLSSISFDKIQDCLQRKLKA